MTDTTITPLKSWISHSEAGHEIYRAATARLALAQREQDEWDMLDERPAETAYLHIEVEEVHHDGTVMDNPDGASKILRLDPEEPDCVDASHRGEEDSVRGHGGGCIVREQCSRCQSVRETDTWGTGPDPADQGWEVISYPSSSDSDSDDDEYGY